MRHFLLEYNRRSGLNRVVGVFEEAEGKAALRARFASEAKHRGDPDVEVVVLASDSLESLAATHRRYFKSVTELVAPELQD